MGNFKLLLKRLKQPSNKKRTRFLEPLLSLDRFAKKLTERSMRRKKSLTTPAKITNAPWIQCKLPWKLNLVPRQRLTSPSSAIKDNFGILRDSWNPRLAKNPKSQKKQDWLNVRLMPLEANLKNLELFLILLIAAR